MSSRSGPTENSIYGYRRAFHDGRWRLVADAHEARNVACAFDLAHTRQLGLRAVADQLNAQGVRRRSRALWNVAAVGRLLGNRAYTAVLTLAPLRKRVSPQARDSEIRNAVPRLVSDQVFLAVQDMLGKRRHSARQRPKNVLRANERRFRRRE